MEGGLRRLKGNKSKPFLEDDSKYDLPPNKLAQEPLKKRRLTKKKGEGNCTAQGADDLSFDTPKSYERMMQMYHAIEARKNEKMMEKRLAGTARSEQKSVPLSLSSAAEEIKLRPGESLKEYSRRAGAAVERIWQENVHGLKRVSAKRKRYLKAREEKKAAKKSMSSEKNLDAPLYEKMAFGDVAQAPPIIKTLPKGAQRKATAPLPHLATKVAAENSKGKSEMHLHEREKLIADKAVSVLRAATERRKTLSLAATEALRQERSRAIEMYRAQQREKYGQ